MVFYILSYETIPHAVIQGHSLVFHTSEASRSIVFVLSALLKLDITVLTFSFVTPMQNVLKFSPMNEAGADVSHHIDAVLTPVWREEENHVY